MHTCMFYIEVMSDNLMYLGYVCTTANIYRNGLVNCSSCCPKYLTIVEGKKYEFFLNYVVFEEVTV
jgi:hypothetical protein